MFCKDTKNWCNMKIYFGFFSFFVIKISLNH